MILARAVSTTAPGEKMASPGVKPAWLAIVEKSVFRFDESESARKEAAPSMSFENASLREEAIDASSTENDKPQFIPLFESDGANQVVTLKVSTLIPCVHGIRFFEHKWFAL